LRAPASADYNPLRDGKRRSCEDRAVDSWRVTQVRAKTPNTSPLALHCPGIRECRPRPSGALLARANPRSKHALPVVFDLCRKERRAIRASIDTAWDSQGQMPWPCEALQGMSHRNHSLGVVDEVQWPGKPTVSTGSSARRRRRRRPRATRSTPRVICLCAAPKAAGVRQA